MILTAHQPAYLPWLGLFHKIALADIFVSFDCVQYLPKEWQNRNLIKTPKGPLWLTVPVLRKGYQEYVIADLRIDNSVPWKRKHLKSLILNYEAAPYFHMYRSFLEEAYRRDWSMLAQLDEYILRSLLEFLGISTKVVRASSYEFRGKKSDLVLDMCKKMGADIYIFGSQGIAYADVDSFRRERIEPLFQNYIHPQYPQQFGSFVSHLSVIDLLANCGDQSLDVLMSGNICREDIEERDRSGGVE